MIFHIRGGGSRPGPQKCAPCPAWRSSPTNATLYRNILPKHSLIRCTEPIHIYGYYISHPSGIGGKRWRIWAHGKEQLFAKCAILTAPPSPPPSSPPSPAPAAAPAVNMGQVLQNFTATVCAAYFKTHTMQRMKGSILDSAHQGTQLAQVYVTKSTHHQGCTLHSANVHTSTSTLVCCFPCSAPHSPQLIAHITVHWQPPLDLCCTAHTLHIYACLCVFVAYMVPYIYFHVLWQLCIWPYMCIVVYNIHLQMCW